MGPLKLFTSATGCPFWVIWMAPAAASALPACRVRSMNWRQRAGKARRGASLGQHVAPGLRARSSSRIVVCSTMRSSCKYNRLTTGVLEGDKAGSGLCGGACHRRRRRCSILEPHQLDGGSLCALLLGTYICCYLVTGSRA